MKKNSLVPINHSLRACFTFLLFNFSFFLLPCGSCYSQAVSKPVATKAVAAQRPTAKDYMKTTMLAKAKEKNLGNVLQGYASPVFYEQNAVYGHVQKFEKGNVYYQYYTGVHAVSKTFLGEFERSRPTEPLGYPVTDEYQDGANTLQLFENAILYYYKDLNYVATWYLKNRASAGSPFDKPGKFGYYRVTLTGFTCNHPTNDDILERDGKGDEVFIASSYFDVDAEGKSTQRINATTKVFGDVNKPEWIAGDASRILFGTKSAFGGIDAKNSYPNNRPYILNQAPNFPVFNGATPLPLIVYEGTLTRDENAAVIVPTIWEWDESSLNAFHIFMRIVMGLGIGEFTNFQLGNLTDALNNGDNSKTELRYLGNILYTFNENDPSSRVTVSKNIFGDPRSRPIGMYDDGDHFSFRPIAMKIGYNEAEQLCNLDALGVGKGIFKIDYIDDPAMQGNYTLYFKIEKLRGN